MKKTTLILIAFLNFIYFANAQWIQSNGPYSGDVRSIIANGSNVFAGTDGNGVFYSSDSGYHWNKASTGLPANININTMAINGANIFIGTYSNGDYGVYKSTDNGTSWTLSNTGLTSPYVRSMLVYNSNIFVGTYNGVFVSTNNGSSWTSVSNGIPVNTIIYSLTISGTNIFAGAAGNIYRSTNNGTSWSSVSSGLTTTTSVNTLAVNGSNIFAGTYNGIYLSTNNGTTWSAINNGLISFTDKAIHSIVINGINIFAATESGVFLSTNNGSSWSTINNGIDNNFINSLTLNGTNIFAGSSDGIFFSNNSGNSWFAKGLPLTDVLSLNTNNSDIYAGTNDKGVFRSTNNGLTWAKINNGLTNYTVKAIAVKDTNIYLGTDGGVFISTNNGNSWAAINNGLFQNALTSLYYINALAINGTTIFASQPFQTNHMGVYRSTNNGGSWTYLNNGIGSNTNTNSLVVMGGAIYAGSANGIWVSYNNGNSWSSFAFPSIETSVTANSNYLYATTYGLNNDGIHISSGSNFNQILNVGNGGAYVVVNDTLVFSLSASSWQLSKNNGVSWKNINANLPTNLSTLAISNIVYAATRGYGIWTRPLSEMICPSPIISPSDSTTFCQGDSVILTANIAGSYLWNNNAATQSIKVFNNGNYFVTVIDSNGCSENSNSVFVNVNPSPSAPIVGTKIQPSCNTATGSVILNGLPSTGTWVINPGNISGTGISKTLTGLLTGTYNYTVTNSSGCTSVASANVVINTQPTTPIAPTVGTITQTTCASSTGSVILNGLPATGTWTINPGNITGIGTSKTITGLTAGTYNHTVTNASGCTSAASANVVINTQPTTPTAPIVGTITQTTCASSTGSVILNGLPATGSWIINPGNISGSGISATISSLLAGTYNYTVTNASACTSVASANVVINTQPTTPTAPTVVIITQPTCLTATGSVVLNGLPATGSWTINPGNITGSGTTTTISSLAAATYNYTVTNASSCTSVASANVVINTQPVTPTAPTVGTITQPTCLTATGSVVLNGLPATGTWIINPGNISGTGITKTITGIVTGTYNYTVTNASSCTSVASANVVINTQPTTPTAPTVGTITQPTCITATGSVVLNGLPATGSWTINPGNINGTGTSTTITNLAAATYNYTVTNSLSCTSVASANIVINTQPLTPTAPTVGTITQPTCLTATGNVVLNGLPATGTWTINPGNITGTGTSTTISNLTAATYNYTVTNSSSCNSVASANIVINIQPSTPSTPVVGTITQPTCLTATGSVVLNGLPATGSWTINPGNITGTGTSTTITNLAAATYNYTVTNSSSCTSVASANVVINTQPATPPTPIITQNGNTLQSNASNGNQWYNLTNGIINNATATTYLPQQIGDYFVIVTLNSCSSDSSNIIHYDNTGIEVVNNNQNLIVYPNPFKNELIIEMEGNKDILDFEILNSIGQQVYKGKIKDKTVIQTANFVPGVYLIKIKNGKTYQFKKIVKE